MGYWRSPPSGTDVRSAVPSPGVRSTISIWLIVHIAFFGISLSAVVAASLLQIQLLNFAAPYLNPLQLRVDARPIYLTHGKGGHEPHRVEWLAAGSTVWQPASVRGRRGSERRRRYFLHAKAIATAAGREDTATASLLALPLVDEVMREVASGERAGEPPVRMRVVRLSLDADSASPLIEPRETAQWEAAIVPEPASRGGEPRWSLVTISGRRLNATPREEVVPREDGDRSGEATP